MPENKKKDGFIMQAGILAAAGIIVRIIGLLYNRPMVAIIGDEGFGYYDSAYAAYSIVLLISSYSIPSAVSKVIAQKLAKKEYRNAHRIFRCALIYVLVVGGIASLFVFFGAGWLVEMNNAVLPLKVLAPTIFFSGILGVLRGYFQAHRTMLQTSVSQILEQIANAGFSIWMAYLLVGAVSDGDTSKQASYGAVGGTIGVGAGVLTALLFMAGVYALNRKTIFKRIERDVHHQEEPYRDIFKLILMVVTPFIISTGIYNINNFMDKTIYQEVMINLKHLGEARVATDLSGIAKATKIANIPIALASAMATAMIPGISGDFVKGEIDSVKDKVAKAVKVTMLISIPAAVGIMALAKPVMQVIFPQKATLDIASRLLMLMAVTIVLYALSTLTQAILQSIGKMNTPIINATLAVVIHAAVMVVLMLGLDETYSLYCYMAATILYALLLCIFNQIAVRKALQYQQEIDRTFIRPVIASVVMGAVAYGVYEVIYYVCGINLVALPIAIVIAVSLYFVLIILWKAVTEEELNSMPKGYLVIAIAKKTKILREEAGGRSIRRKRRKKSRGNRKTVKKKKHMDQDE